jgi:hypothetical protein
LNVGAFSRVERMATWNDGIRIEDGRDAPARFACASVLFRG